MKEYKVEFARTKEEAERVMNEYAAKGWSVISTAYWYKWNVGMIITFEKQSEEK